MKRRPLRHGSLILAIVACCLAVAWSIELSRPRVEPLEYTIARVPLGITAQEADARMGGAPDRLSQMSGVLMNPVTMLAASNSLAAKYGAPTQYDLRIWEQGPTTAIVAVGPDGLVAGRYAVNAGKSGLRSWLERLTGWGDKPSGDQ